MNNLLKILSNVLEEEKSKNEKDKFKNLTDLYNLCVSKGYVGDIAKFKSEYTKLVEQCSNMLKNSEVSDLDLESVAGGVNTNVSLKSSIAMIMSALSLSGSTSSIASAANPKFKSNNSSISSKVATWDRSKSDLTKGQVLATGIGAAVGTALLSIPITALVTSDIILDSVNEFDADAMDNVIRLVYSLNAAKSDSVSFNNLNENERAKLVKSAYKELNIKLDDKNRVGVESIRATLLSKLNEEIAKLNKDSGSDKVKLKLSRLSILKMCLETKSNIGITTAQPSAQLAQGTMLPPPPGKLPPPPPPDLDLVVKKELTKEERETIEKYNEQLANYREMANNYVEIARKNYSKFSGEKTQEHVKNVATNMLNVFNTEKNKFEQAVRNFQKALNNEKLKDLDAVRKDVYEKLQILKKSAEEIGNAEQRALRSQTFDITTEMKNRFNRQKNSMPE